MGRLEETIAAALLYWLHSFPLACLILSGYWLTQAAFWAFLLPFFFVRVYDPTNNPLIVKVDASSIGGLSLTPGESPKGRPSPNASLPQVVALGMGLSFREGQALWTFPTTILLWTWPVFFKMVFFFFGWNKWTNSIARRMSSTDVFESLSVIQSASTQFQSNFI